MTLEQLEAELDASYMAQNGLWDAGLVKDYLRKAYQAGWKAASDEIHRMN